MSRETWHARRIKRIVDAHAVAIFAQTGSMAKVRQVVLALSNSEVEAIVRSAYLLAEAAARAEGGE